MQRYEHERTRLMVAAAMAAAVALLVTPFAMT